MLRNVIRLDDARFLLEALSDVRYVSNPAPRDRQYIQRENRLIDLIVEKLLSLIEDEAFFKEWGIYEKIVELDPRELEVLLQVINIVLEIHPDDELTTYVGYNREQIQEVRRKLALLREEVSK